MYPAQPRDRLRDLGGYFARLSQNAANAPCKWRSACCSGTDDTSGRKARSPVRFHSVSIAEDCTQETRSARWYHASVRAASARLYTFRTQPNVRASSAS